MFHDGADSGGLLSNENLHVNMPTHFSNCQFSKLCFIICHALYTIYAKTVFEYDIVFINITNNNPIPLAES